MSDVAFGQLAWFCMGLLCGFAATVCVAVHQGWFERKAVVKLTVDWDTIGPGVGGALNEAAKHIRPATTINVDWSFINAVLAGEGYMLVAKPRDSDAVARVQ